MLRWIGAFADARRAETPRGDVVDAIDVEAPGEARPAGPVVVRGGRVVREGEPEPEAGADEPPPPSIAGGIL